MRLSAKECFAALYMILYIFKKKKKENNKKEKYTFLHFKMVSHYVQYTRMLRMRKRMKTNESWIEGDEMRGEREKKLHLAPFKHGKMVNAMMKALSQKKKREKSSTEQR